MDDAIYRLANDAEIEHYAEAVAAYLNARMDAEHFTAVRLQQGIYGQRQEGVNMVRIKLPGGRLTTKQLLTIAEVTAKHAQADEGHITTRQDIQLHYVPLQDTPAVLKRLASADLTTREACGNTIRNVTACPLAGLCPHEHTDVRQHLDGAVRHFLRNPLNQQLPRKFKISFSGCETDCAQGLLHDLGVVAIRREGRFGFKVMAGGGLGHKPHEAIVVEPFIEERELLLVLEAIVALHNRYSDRTKRAKSRIKFLVDRFGPEGFVEKYREELTRVKEALGTRAYPRGSWQAGAPNGACAAGAPRRLFEQKQAGLFVVPISVPLGQLSSANLRRLAETMEKFRLSEVRTTQDQNLMLVNVPAADVDELRRELAALGLREPQTGDNVVACPGTSTCRLGITSSTIVAPKLSGGPADLRIRVSGCHNGCAQPETGDIGIYGEGRRLHGKLIPHYQTYFGGDGRGGGALAIKGPSVPAARIEEAVKRVQDSYLATREGSETFFSWSRKHDQAFFAALLADLVTVKEEDVPVVLRDHGDSADFRVLQLGGGECAGASQVQIGSNFFDAAHERGYRDALLFQRKYADAAKCADNIARLIGDGLLQLLGGKKEPDLPAVAHALSALLPRQPAFAATLSRCASVFALPEEALSEKTLKPVFEELDALTLAAAELCAARGLHLELAGALPRAAPARVIPIEPLRSPTAAEAAL
jgi:sulfite reductase (ferredoxin)